MSANNETGTLQPVREIGALCRERGVLFHSDAIQSFGKEPLAPRSFDALSLAAHKFHGPKGAGLLYLRAGLPIERLQLGGSHENERRPGTENSRGHRRPGRGRGTGLGLDGCGTPAAGGAARPALGGDSRRVPGGGAATAIRSTPGQYAQCRVSPASMAKACSSISISRASAPRAVRPAWSVDPASHVLLAMGVPPALARATVRFSLGHETTRRRNRSAISRLPEIFAQTRARRPSLGLNGFLLLRYS